MKEYLQKDIKNRKSLSTNGFAEELIKYFQ